ncbi:hypothetical protein KBC04_05120 [Candidatus Babeliales bacterium]|nr:hypothetical protein [Candidatus Babeliales bacterium]MBP9844227.1 hypothetical protein [Candidatus Babeliales bacterium]
MTHQAPFIFNLAPDKKIIILIEESDEPINADFECQIAFEDQGQRIFITQDSTLDIFISTLHKLLRKGVHQELLLHKSMIENPGYLYNQWLNEADTNLIYLTNQYHETYWVGFKYQLTSHVYTSWIYNNKKGDIIFEMTPIYPASLIDESNPIEVANYKKWMKNYQPVVTEIIPKEIAQQWLAQTTEISATLDKNSAKLHAQ